MKLRVTIKGKVHGVGYRVKLINMALEYGIDKFSVFNTEIDGKPAVICLIDAPDEIVEIIKQRIRAEKPEKAEVESISFEDYKYEVPPIERCMQAFQMEHWGKAIPILLNMIDKQDSALSKMDEMLKKQDETIKVIREEGEKTREELGSKIDSVKETIREESEKTRQTVREESEKTRAELKSEIRGVKEELSNLRADLKEYMEANLKRIYDEIAEIKNALKKAGIM